MACYYPDTQPLQTTTMTEEIDGNGPRRAKPPRQDRLKQALRENLKRRKAQARQRSGKSGEADERAPPDDRDGDAGA